jgi:signal transduction histidine kinase
MALIITALLLVYSYRDHAARHYDEHVTMHLEELLDASGLLPDGTLELAYSPSDPRYDDLHSGWYWEVRQSGKSLQRSPSLGENRLDLGGLQATNNVVVHELIGPAQDRLRVQVVEIESGSGLEPLIFLASAPLTGFTDDVLNYSTHILGSFLLLGIGLLMAVVLQVRIALKPLKAISTGIIEIREGRASKLSQNNLEDVQPLVDELNNLLDHNAILLKRARNRLADLAHSVKNPLAVINNEARNLEADQKELILQQTSDLSKNVDHYLSRARAFGTEKVLGSRSAVKTAVEDLVYAMQRIYQERDLNYDFPDLKECWFRGESQDLEEMIGNLMDNACKWAKKHVSIRAETEGDRLLLIVEDDGPGIPEEEIENVMRRGHKLDESKPGHGQGMGIVKDIVDLYGGKLKLGKSPMGGLQAKLDLPAA